MPTASAVVADSIDALKDGVKIHDSLFWQPAEPIDGYYVDTERHDYYVRLGTDGAEAFAELEGAQVVAGQNAAVLPRRSAAELAAEGARLGAEGAKVGINMKMMSE